MIRRNTIRHLADSGLEGAALDAKMAEVESQKFKGIDSDGNGAISQREYAISRAAAAARKAEKRANESK